MKNKIIRIVVIFSMIFVLCSDIIFHNISLPYFFKWWDVALEIILLLFFIKEVIDKLLNKKDKKIRIEARYTICYIALIAIIVIGLLGDVIFQYFNSFYAVVIDIFSFLKFPLTFLLLKNLGFNYKMDNLLDRKFYNILKCLIIIIMFFGVISQFCDIGMSHGGYRYGIKPYKFIFSHPTYLVLSMILILSLFEYGEKNKKQMVAYEILIVLITFLTMRTKAIVFLVVFFILKFCGKYIKKYKKTSIVLIGLVMFVTAFSKLSLYASFSYSTREVLYRGCIKLLAMCYPIGSGFATYASYISGQYMSKVYDFINVDYVFKTGYLAQLGDVGFPYYIGQFGILGCKYIAVLAFEIVKISLEKSKNKLPIYILLLYIVIGLTTESTLLNLGTELAVVLAIVSTEKKQEM